MLPKSTIQRLKEDGIEYDLNDIPEDYKQEFVNLGVSLESVFYAFYSHAGFPPLGNGDELYTFEQICEDNENNYWENKYPGISKRYLQLSSIEGEGSYFYDRETDAVYDVGWENMESFMTGHLNPKWKNFSNFLEWYYGE